MMRFTLRLSLALLFCACPPKVLVPVPTVVSFSASPGTLPYGGGVVTLSWTQADGERVSIDQGVGDVSNKTSVSVALTQTTTFTLTVTNSAGWASANVSVTVAPQPGSLDSSFGTDGLAVSTFGVTVLAAGMTATADGEVIVVGHVALPDSTSDFLVLRYDAKGQLEPSFGIAGQTSTDLDGGLNDMAAAVDVTDTGRIVVAGIHGFGPDFDSGVARYLSKGELDTSFSDDGKLVLPWATLDRAYAVKALTGGETLLAGIYDQWGSADVAVQKLRANGEPDHRFAGNGKLRLDFDGGYDWASAIAVQNDGKILVAGGSVVGSESDGVVTRLNTDGSTDTTFGTAGVQRLVELEGDSFVAMTTQATGEIVGVGSALNPSTGVEGLMLVRLGEDGQRDLLFGVGGIVTNWLPGGRRFEPAAVAVQADGRIVVGGWAEAQGGAGTDLAVVRYNGDGSIDATFGTNGVVTIAIDGSNEAAVGLAIQPDGKIVVGGGNELSEIVLVRLNP